MIDINDFVGRGDCREYMNQPFTMSGRTMASNGHLIISVPEASGFNYCEDLDSKKVRDMLDDAMSADYVILGDIDMPERSKCKVCKGCGKASESECDECDGRGEVELSNDYNEYEVDCKSCNGSGENVELHTEIDCYSCDGSGEVFPEFFSIEIDGAFINAKYVEKIKRLPDVMVCSDAKKNMLYFNSGDAYGVILGMRQ